jgi:hypothetical protein
MLIACARDRVFRHHLTALHAPWAPPLGVWQLEALREQHRKFDTMQRGREAELADLRRKLDSGDFTAAHQVCTSSMPCTAATATARPFIFPLHTRLTESSSSVCSVFIRAVSHTV